jgi:hypothetical protein
MDETRTTSNVPEYSVGEIAVAVRRTLEGAFGRVRVRGEIAELRRYPSGHIYLALKDENAKLKAVIWKSAVSRLGLKPEEGIEVIATGRITTYGDRSEYQLQIDRLEYAGAGALLARIEMLRQKLLAEGLFDEARKRPIPRLPAVIGVVSSEKGAVIQDIRTTIARRFPRPVLLTPHAGEMAHLTGQSKADLQADPAGAERQAAASWNAVVALKGALTCIATPDGRCWQHQGGNIGLAVSGSGDTLAGMVAGLAARGAPLEQAAAWGVALPARAGDNLYWLGRYVERAETATRQLRAWHLRLGEGIGAEEPLLAALGQAARLSPVVVAVVDGQPVALVRTADVVAAIRP